LLIYPKKFRYKNKLKIKSTMAKQKKEKSKEKLKKQRKNNKTKKEQHQNKQQKQKNKGSQKEIKKSLLKKILKKIKKYDNLREKQTIRKKISEKELNYIINELLKRGMERKFITFSEILSFIPYPEYNIKAIDKIFDKLNEADIQLTKNIDLLDTSEEISVDEMLKDTNPEE